MAESSQPVIQVLSKENYTEQHLVSLPDTQLKLDPLPASRVRVKSRLLALTTNNLSYARMGHLFGWWDVHPLPAATPAPFNDASKYGRVSAWGFGEVLESDLVENVPSGTLLYGYLPIGTLPVDLRLDPSPLVKGHFVETSPHRSHLWNLYNRYIILPRSAKVDTAEQAFSSLAWDALLLVFFECGYNINRFVFPWDGAGVSAVHPLGVPEMSWPDSSSRLTKSVVIIFAASGKTALAFAQQLSRRPDKDLMRVIGVTSPSSRKFVGETGFYPDVVLYEDLQNASDMVKSAVAADKCEKVVLCDFGARGNAAKEWLNSFRASPFCAGKDVVWLGVAGGSTPLSHEDIVKVGGENQALGRIQVNASGMRDAAMSQMGERRYFEEMLAAWDDLKAHGGVPGLRFKVGKGMEEVDRAWTRICDGEMKPDEGLLFEL